ncbi:hypothetical protein ZWY2020_059326 [Hordeum vulgare]|nr:hypothetical protein ZWY2020_059326 [Hordeum vulgare]
MSCSSPSRRRRATSTPCCSSAAASHTTASPQARHHVPPPRHRPAPLRPFRVTAISDGFDDGGMAACPDFREYVHRLAAAGSEPSRHSCCPRPGRGGLHACSSTTRTCPRRAAWLAPPACRRPRSFSQPCTVDVVYGEVYTGRVGLPVVDGSVLRGLLSVDLGPEDVPSFVAAPESYHVLLDAVVGQFDGLEDADDVFVNSFHELETKVRPLARDPKNVHLKQMDEAQENLHLFRADVLDYDTLTRALEGCEGIFHLATPVPEDKIVDPEAEVLAPAVKGTSNVLKACSAMKVQKILLFAVAKDPRNSFPS